MTRFYTTVLSTIVAVAFAAGSALAYSVAERWVSALVIAVTPVAVAAFAMAHRAQRELDQHLEETRAAAAEIHNTAAEIRRTINKD